MSIFKRLVSQFGYNAQEVNNQLKEVEPTGDRHEQAMQIFDHAIAKASTMEDTPEKLAFVLLSLQKGLDLTMQDDSLANAEELKRLYEAGEISEEYYRSAMDSTLDRFVNYGGLE